MSEHQRPILERKIAEHLDRGDLRAAATEALKGYGDQILIYLTAVLQDEEAAREVFAQFAEDLWKGLVRFRGECSFKTWAYKVAWSAVRYYLRDPYRKRGRRLGTTELSEIAAQVQSSTAAYLKSTVKDEIARLRERLEPHEQTLLVLRVDRQMSWAEVAAVLSEPGRRLDEVTLRNRFQRVKAKLRKMAVEAGVFRK